MLKTLRQNYQKAPHFKEVFPLIASLLWMAPISENLARFNEMCIINLCYRMNILRGFERSSGIEVEGKRDARIIELCKYAGADTYYSGSGAKDYHIESDYNEAGIDLVYSDYSPVEYPQTFCGQNGDSEFSFKGCAGAVRWVNRRTFKVNTFGSTRLQAVGFYIQEFMR